ncbi:hypothetical protein BDV59DRAFT_202785 [Aspergillus ambiguus]|uniref:hydroxynaphthalene reductase arp2 n=1 Tax=Aspergillus ambiguus TaxID=176160 RepID=UPI003CCD8AE7
MAETHLPLTGKVALVTGGARGIGAGISIELARRGASVAINYAHSPESANAVVSAIDGMGRRSLALKADLRNVGDIESLLSQVVSYFGHLDIVVSNSGVEKFRPLDECTLDDFNEVFDLNTRAQFFLARYAYPYLEPGGRLILMSSIAAEIGIPGHALYAGSKAAITGFTRCLAADYGKKRCTVNAIAPAGVKTDMWRDNAWRYAPGCNHESPVVEIEKALAVGSPLKRCGLPEDIGRVVSFLACPDSEWVNGQVIPVNGGANI